MNHTIGSGLPSSGRGVNAKAWISASAGRPIVWGGLLSLLLCSSCVPPANSPGSAAKKKIRSPQEAAEYYRKAMTRENGPFPKHKLSLIDGLATGEIESQTPPRPECRKDEDGDLACQVAVDMGKDDEGDPYNIVCAVATYITPFSVPIHQLLDGGKLMETPQLEVKQLGQGLSVRFEANFQTEEQTRSSFGTMKVALYQSLGYEARCWDRRAGGRQTFARISEQFFETLKFKEFPGRPALFALGHTTRAGDRPAGYSYTYIAKRPGEEGSYDEFSTYFSLETDGKSWHGNDGALHVSRDAKGEIEYWREAYWVHGAGPAILSAKPSEEGRFRIKFEVGTRSESVESTPKAPLQTELWAAPELAKVLSGAIPSYRYAILGFEDSDPAFKYITVTRSSNPGVLLEEEELGKKASRTKPAEAQARDELHVDARGMVPKEVSSKHVRSVAYVWGELPWTNRRIAVVESSKKPADAAVDTGKKPAAKTKAP